MTDNPSFLPFPQQVILTGDICALGDGRLILLDAPDPQRLRFAAARWQQTLKAQLNLTWEVVASRATPNVLIGLTLRLAPAPGARSQGYELRIAPAGIVIEAADAAGLFYGVCTLIQIVAQAGRELPCLRIVDWPDFPARGVMLDVSRDKVPTMATLLDLADMLAGWKVNQLQLYTEHTFAYRNHPEVWAAASPLTGQEILELDVYCQERHIELVPNQNSFGHMHCWLDHPRYAGLAEVVGEFVTPWGEPVKGPFSLCPLDPGSLELMRSLYDELLPHFSSRLFNVGCDETWDLGQGRSKAAGQAQGTGRVYLDFLLKIHREVSARGRTMQFWGDIIVEHPELIAELPRDVIALEWGYEAEHPFDARCPKFAAAGIPFYVCPGTSSWNSIAGRTANALANLRRAAESGLQHGAIGYLNTDWGDDGHWQPLPVSYLGFAYGAAVSWGYAANQALDVPAALSAHAFRDPTGVLGRVAYAIGETYRKPGVTPDNASVLFEILQAPREKITELKGLTAQGLQDALDHLETVAAGLPAARSTRPDAALLQQEFAWAAEMLRHACHRGLWALAGGDDAPLRAALAAAAGRLIAGQREIWLARNRPGGLPDSAARLEKLRRP